MINIYFKFYRVITITVISLLILFYTMPVFASSTIEKAMASTVRIFCVVGKSIGTGSGFVIGDGGHVATNWHVVSGVTQGGRVVIYLGPKNTVEAKVVWHSEQKDLAVLQLAQKLNKPTVEFINSKDVKVGDEVFAMGFPAAADKEAAGLAAVKVTKGIISATKEVEGGTRLFQTDAALNPGNSGGPLFNKYGQVVGINAQKSLTGAVVVGKGGKTFVERLPLGEGIGWAIQANELLVELKSLNIPFAVADKPDIVHQMQREEPFVFYGIILAVLCGVVGVVLAATKRGRVVVQEVKEAVTRSKVVANKQTSSAKELKAVLRGLTGTFGSSEIVLGNEPLIIGRDPKQCQLVFPSESSEISRKHSVLRYDTYSNKFILEDFSSNGTFLGSGERLKVGEPRQLQVGERFYLGNTSNLFEVNIQ